MSSPLVGAWELNQEEPDGWHGMWIFTETHYAGIFEQKGRNLGFEGEKPTETEEAYGYRTAGGGGGRYTLAGKILTLSEEWDRLLDGHRPVRWEFSIEGDRLLLRDPEGGQSATLRKLS